MFGSLVRCAVDAGVATVTLDRPDKRNALTPEMLAELEVLVHQLGQRTDLHLVVLRGAGPAFCAGHDKGQLATSVGAARGAGHSLGTWRAEARAVDAVARLPVPTLARVHGHCLAGGLELALACDLVVAADNCRIGDVHARLGLVPVWGLPERLTRRVGRARAIEIAVRSLIISGTQAHAWGLVDHCAPERDLDDRIAQISNDISLVPQDVLRATMSLYRDDAAPSRHDSAMLMALSRLLRQDERNGEGEPGGHLED